MTLWYLLFSAKELESIEGHGHFVNSVSYSPNGSFILSGSVDMTCRIFNSQVGSRAKREAAGVFYIVLS